MLNRSGRLSAAANLSLLLAVAACSSRGQDSAITAVCRDGRLPGALLVSPANGTMSLPRQKPGKQSFVPSTKADIDNLKTCLEAEKTRLETRKLVVDLANSTGDLSVWSWIVLILQNFAVIVAVLGALGAFARFIRERRKAREESQNQRFDAVVAALGKEIEEAQVGGAALLPTFLEPGYERFFVPVYRLAVAYLTPDESEFARSHRNQRRSKGTASGKTTGASSVDQLLAAVLKSAYPLALVQLIRERSVEQRQEQAPLSLRSDWTAESLVQSLTTKGLLRRARSLSSEELSAERIVLDRVRLVASRFPLAFFRNASFRECDAAGIDLRGAMLEGADFTETVVSDGRLPKAKAAEAAFTGAKLGRANLSELDGRKAIFDGAELAATNFIDADLTGARFIGARFDLPNEEKDHSTIELAKSLRGADFSRAEGLTAEQIELCRKKGAINLPTL